MPSTITGLRLSMGVAWMVIVAVEMMCGKTGIGYYVWNEYNAGSLSHVRGHLADRGRRRVLDLCSSPRPSLLRGRPADEPRDRGLWKSFPYGTRAGPSRCCGTCRCTSSRASSCRSSATRAVASPPCSRRSAASSDPTPARSARRRVVTGRGPTGPWCSSTTRCCPALEPRAQRRGRGAVGPRADAERADLAAERYLTASACGSTAQAAAPGVGRHAAALRRGARVRGRAAGAAARRAVRGAGRAARPPAGAAHRALAARARPRSC